MKVVDFFCGAGGFSEGFRQAGYEIVQGIEINKTALTSFNFNFGTNDKPTNILEIVESVESINKYIYYYKKILYVQLQYSLLIITIEKLINALLKQL